MTPLNSKITKNRKKHPVIFLQARWASVWCSCKFGDIWTFETRAAKRQIRAWTVLFFKCFSLTSFFPTSSSNVQCHQNLHEHHLPRHLSPQCFLIYFNCFDNLNTFTIHSGSSEPEANTLLSHLLINFLRESTISYVTLVAVGRIIY